MGIEQLPHDVRRLYEVHEWNHACAILSRDFPQEWRDIIDVLLSFQLLKSHVAALQRGKSPVSQAMDTLFYQRGWQEKAFETQVMVDKEPIESRTHKVDCFRNRVALEIEWNNKDTFYDRDLNNFRILFDLRAISVGVIITRSDELQSVFCAAGKRKWTSTTHMSKLLPRIKGGGCGGCPLLVLGITRELYVDD